VRSSTRGGAAGAVRSTTDPSDYTRIPLRDLPFGMPAWLGGDAAGRAAKPRHSNSVERDPIDLLYTPHLPRTARSTLIFHEPTSRLRPLPALPH